MKIMYFTVDYLIINNLIIIAILLFIETSVNFKTVYFEIFMIFHCISSFYFLYFLKL